MKQKECEAPKSLLETTLNTRDLGGYFSETAGKPLQKWRILRSDVPRCPSARDIACFADKDIRTTIDLRGEEDALQKPSGFLGREGFFYRNVPIDEGSGIPESTDAVSKSYMKIAESKNIAQVFREIAAAPGGVMIHCTAGKDRTGVVSAVLLGLCGVPEETIIADYLLTKPYSTERFEQIHRNFPEIDMNIVIPQERYMKEFLGMLKAKYGTFPEYLCAIGVTEQEMEAIKAKFL